MDMQIIGRNIREWRERRHLKLNELARLAGIDRGNLSRLESGQMGASIETLTKLASALHVPMAALMQEGSNVVVDFPSGMRRIRILEWDQAFRWKDLLEAVNDANMKEHVMLSVETSDHTFALRVQGDAMEPEFHPGDVIVVDPDRTPKPGSLVIAEDSTHSILFSRFRDLGIDAGGRSNFELLPLNPLYAVRRSDRENLSIIGVAIYLQQPLEK